MKRILITGFSGFVSAHFLDFLEHNQIKAEVAGVDLNFPESIAKTYQYIKWKFIQLDLLDKPKVLECITSFKPEYIINLASFSSVAYSWLNPGLSFQNNINNYINILESLRELKISCRLLAIGSSEVYGNVGPDHLPIREENPVDPISPYAVARVTQEYLNRIYSSKFGLDIIMTRSFNHFGPGQKETFVIPAFAKQLINIKKNQNGIGDIITGDNANIRDFCDVRDVVRAYFLLLKKGRSGEIYNVCSGNSYSLKEILDKMVNLLAIKINIRQDPSLIRPNDVKVTFGSNEKLLLETGWKPAISIDKTLGDIIDEWLNKT